MQPASLARAKPVLNSRVREVQIPIPFLHRERFLVTLYFDGLLTLSNFAITGQLTLIRE